MPSSLQALVCLTALAKSSFSLSLLQTHTLRDVPLPVEAGDNLFTVDPSDAGHDGQVYVGTRTAADLDVDRGMETTRRRKVLGSSGPKVAWNDYGLAPSAAPVLSSDFGFDYVNWSMCSAAYHSNLAGVGPDVGEESIRYSNVATATGQGIDLVITANSSYGSRDVNVNGLVSEGSCFGVVNLKSLPSGYNYVDLLFSLYLAGTNTSVAFNKFYMTVYDFDSSTTAIEHVTFHNRVQELFYVPDHVMNITGDLDAVGLTFTSTQLGTGKDNPQDPLNLTHAQKQKSVMVSFENQTQWRLKFAVTGGKQGRNFAFAGLSNLLIITTTTTTTSKPTTTETDVGEPSTTTTTTCYMQSCQIWADPHVSGFDNSENQGPDYFALFRFSGRAHTFDGRPVDVDEYDTGNFWLVKNKLVYIQAQFRRSGEFIPDRAAVGAVAVGGPFLNGTTFVVEPLDGNLTIDGKLLPGGTWSAPWSDPSGTFTLQVDGEDVQASFPMGVKLSCKRFAKHVDVQITMPKLEDGMDGECGNYDGIAENDEESNIQDRMGDTRVDDSMLLFAKNATSSFDSRQDSLKSKVASAAAAAAAVVSSWNPFWHHE